MRGLKVQVKVKGIDVLDEKLAIAKNKLHEFEVALSDVNRAINEVEIQVEDKKEIK